MNVVLQNVDAWLGWCPCCRTRAGTQGSEAIPEMDVDPDGRQRLAGTLSVPAGFTALSVALLFATCFAGGEAWWPAFVPGIAAAGIIAMAARPGQGCAG